ncbi:MAG: hypothetical protein EBX68_08270, partial [Betaproteobacteria bacterium]|nr:hypothetical protein [Betaproteobacteria bacterium]
MRIKAAHQAAGKRSAFDKTLFIDKLCTVNPHAMDAKRIGVQTRRSAGEVKNPTFWTASDASRIKPVSYTHLTLPT